jgi:hypothetical protein
MVRFLMTEEAHYSLKDVTNWLTKQAVLTNEQGQLFSFRCRAHVAQKLANAYEEYFVLSHLEPIILPNHDYFIHWIVWANLLRLLPGETGKHPKVDYLNLLLDNPETVYLQPQMKYGIKLVCLNNQYRLGRLLNN